jgi:PhzF family phenazine biosynthesis protein
VKLFIVDAFTDRIFGGNQAGVVLLKENDDFPKPDIMQKVAAELRYSETAFVKATGNNTFTFYAGK